MLYGTLPTTLHQIFCQFSSISKVIFKSFIGADDTFLGDIEA